MCDEIKDHVCSFSATAASHNTCWIQTYFKVGSIDIYKCQKLRDYDNSTRNEEKRAIFGFEYKRQYLH